MVEFDLTGYTAIAKSEKLFSELKKITSENLKVTLKATKAKKLCTGSAQIIVAFVADIEDKGGKVSWEEISDDFLNSIDKAGWKEKLGIN